MTQQQIQQTMDFILRSQADSVVRMEKWEERFEKFDAQFEARHAQIQKEIDDLAAEIRDLMKSQREYAKSQQKYEKRMRALEASDRRSRRRVEGIKDLMRLFSKRADLHSTRINRLERNGR